MGIVKWLIRIIIDVAFLVNLFTFLLSAYEKGYEKKAPDIPLYKWVLAFIYEFFLSLLNIVLYPFGFVDFSHIKLGKEDKDLPIIIVHPYMMNRACTFYIFLRLKLRGYKNVFAVNISPKTAPIGKQAEMLRDQIDLILENIEKNEFTGIGHSQGGLILMYYKKHLDTENKLKKIITIGSPLQGTKIAIFSSTPNGKEMRYNSEFVKKLAEGKVDAEILNIYSPIDNLVLPHSSAILKNVQHIEAPPVGHISLLFHPSVFHSIIDFIEHSEQPST